MLATWVVARDKYDSEELTDVSQYGLSLISGSETVLYVSLAAHACQFAFLVFFEDPRRLPICRMLLYKVADEYYESDIERTYGERKPLAMRVPLKSGQGATVSDNETPSPFSGDRASTPKPRRSSVSSSASAPDSLADTPVGTDESDYETDTDATSHAFRNGSRSRRESEISEDLDADQPTSPSVNSPSMPCISTKPARHRPQLLSKHDFDAYYFRNDLLMLKNFDPLRATDFAFALAVFYLVAAVGLTLLSLRAQLVALFINALAWRIIHTFGLGSILKAQSERKWMVRHYLSESRATSLGLQLTRYVEHYHYESTGYGAVEEAFSNWKGIYNISVRRLASWLVPDCY